jgi:hypothetical protein
MPITGGRRELTESSQLSTVSARLEFAKIQSPHLSPLEMVTKRFGSIFKTPGARVIAVTASLLSLARLHARADVVYRPVTLDGVIFFFLL